MWNGGNGLSIGGVVSNDALVELKGKLNTEGSGGSLGNSDLLKDLLHGFKVNLASGHGHDSVSQGLAQSFDTDEELEGG